MKCDDCCNDRYRTNLELTGCVNGRDCWTLEAEKRSISEAKNKTEELTNVIFSITDCAKDLLTYVINLALKDNRKIFINGTILQHFDGCLISKKDKEIIFFGESARLVIPFENSSNIIACCTGNDINITIDAQ